MSHGTPMGSIMFLNVTTERTPGTTDPAACEATTWPPLRYASTHFAGCPVICAVERALRLKKVNSRLRRPYRVRAGPRPSSDIKVPAEELRA